MEIGIDELNVIKEKKRAVPYKEYFDTMDLTAEQKKKREELSEELEGVMLFMFTLLSLYRDYSIEINYMNVTATVAKRYMDSIKSMVEDLTNNRVMTDAYVQEINSYLEEYSKEFADDVVRSTMDNIDDDYYMSNDRAMFAAENEANTVLNYLEFKEAMANGKTRKRWVDIRDSRERKTHRQVGGTVIGINEAFMVGNSLMMFPKDTSMGADAKEIVNCRCTIKYL